MSNIGGYTVFHKIATSFVVRNVAPNGKRIRIFNYPINNGEERDLLAIPGISEADIRHSLLKGELLIKILNKETVITQSDIDLLQFNPEQKAFLESGGLTEGHEVNASELASGISPTFNFEQDVELVGNIDSSNLIFTIPSGKFLYTANYRITVYLNGVRQQFTKNYIIAESEGPGTGYDMIVFIDDAPDPGDVIVADYYQSS